MGDGRLASTGVDIDEPCSAPPLVCLHRDLLKDRNTLVGVLVTPFTDSLSKWLGKRATDGVVEDPGPPVVWDVVKGVNRESPAVTVRR